jgi:hypothetical protein
MLRINLIEQIKREIYGGQPNDDANITDTYINQLLNQGVALAAKQNYNESIQLEGIAYVNNSFYTTYKGLTISEDENALYKITLPEIPVGIGTNAGISTLQFKDNNTGLSQTAYPLSQNQVGYIGKMKPIPNAILYYSEGIFAYMITTYILTNFTSSVRMISGGDYTNLNSVLNVPQDYINTIVTYVKKVLMEERMIMPDLKNDGNDILTR